MPNQYTRADSIREYLTGSLSDGGIQNTPTLSLGGFRSSLEAASLGMQISNPIPNVKVLYASGANPIGANTLLAVDANNLSWMGGPPTFFSGTNDIEIVESPNPGAYLRVQGTPPFAIIPQTVTLAYIYNNIFGLDDIASAQAASGISEYFATIIRCEGPGVLNFKRWITTYGTPQTSNTTHLGASGSGTIVTTGSFVDWPTTGWCQVQSSGGTIKEVIYYSSRTVTALTVPVAGRGLLGTSATIGTATDRVFAVPGIALAEDSTGVQVFGTSIQTVASGITAPVGVTWNLGLTAGTGLQVGSIPNGQQVGIWVWRQMPAGVAASPQVLTELMDSFLAM